MASRFTTLLIACVVSYVRAIHSGRVRSTVNFLAKEDPDTLGRSKHFDSANPFEANPADTDAMNAAEGGTPPPTPEQIAAVKEYFGKEMKKWAKIARGKVYQETHPFGNNGPTIPLETAMATRGAMDQVKKQVGGFGANPGAAFGGANHAATFGGGAHPFSGGFAPPKPAATFGGFTNPFR